MSPSERIAELKAQMEKHKLIADPLAEEVKRIAADRQAEFEAYQAKVFAIAERERANREKQYEAQVAFNQAKWELEKLEREAEAARLAAENAARIAKVEADRAAQDAALTDRFDLLTLGLPWREWAKDHQIAAAHKIVQDMRVILADGMGLGKTLSSIITCDMAERVTANASPTEPFLGELKEVQVSPAGYYWTESGERCGYIPFDSKNKYEAEGTIEHRAAVTAPAIVGGIERPVGRRILYLCPSALLTNVMSEWRMWSPKRNVTYIGGMTRAERKWALDMLPMLDNYVIICNFEAWRRDQRLLDSLIEADFDTIIIDEAHNVKDMQSVAYKGIDRLLNEANFSYVIPMTGTPVLNRPQELYTLLHIVAPDVFYNLNEYLMNFCEQREDEKWYFQPGGMDRLAKRINKFFLKRTKAQAGINLPPNTRVRHELEVDTEKYPEQAKARQQMKEFATIVIDEAEGKALSANAIIALYTRLRQIETWPAGIVQYKKHPITGLKTNEILLQLDVEESQKVDYCINNNEDGEWNGLIPNAIGEERMVLFSQFKAPLREIRDRVNASGFRAVVLDGETPKDVREAIRVDFDARYTSDRAKSTWDIVLCNYKVGGVGFNLTAASQLIDLDSEWNPGKRDQAYDRIDRMGQALPTTTHVIRAKGTIDAWLDTIMDAKDDMVNGFENVMTDPDYLRKLINGDLGDSGLA